MFNEITYSHRDGFRIPLMILGIIYSAVMGVLVVIRSILVYVFTILLAVWETEFTSDIVFDIIANLLIITAYSFVAVGVFMLKKTAKPFGIGWLCYALQVLVGCIALPFISDSYGDTEYHIPLLPVYVLLFLCAAVIGMTMLLGRGNKWAMLVATVLGAVAFVVTLFMGDVVDIGTLGSTVSYVGAPLFFIGLLISNGALFVSTILVAFSYKSTYY